MNTFEIRHGADSVVIEPDDIGLVACAVDQIIMSEDRLKTTYNLRSWKSDQHAGHVDWNAEEQKATFVRSDFRASGPVPSAIQAVSAVEVPRAELPNLLDALNRQSAT